MTSQLNPGSFRGLKTDPGSNLILPSLYFFRLVDDDANTFVHGHTLSCKNMVWSSLPQLVVPGTSDTSASAHTLQHLLHRSEDTALKGNRLHVAAPMLALKF